MESKDMNRMTIHRRYGKAVLAFLQEALSIALAEHIVAYHQSLQWRLLTD